MIGSSVEDLICERVFFDVSQHIASRGNRVYMKIEGFNPAGSIKIKTAKYLLADALRRSAGRLSGVIESSSGNLGIALAMLCAARGIRFECVVDPNTLQEKIALIRYLGAEVTVVTRRDANGGYLGARIEYITQKLAEQPGLVWTNQYANPANTLAHFSETAAAIHDDFPTLDYLFVGAGTTGTLFGCTRYFSQHSPRTKIIAVDSIGSVTFGGPPGSRFVPGIGTSRRPGFVEDDYPQPATIMNIAEEEGLRVCRRFSRQTGLLVGGSTGSVIAAFEEYAAAHDLRDRTVVLISPDLGQSYLSTVYDDAWVARCFPGYFTRSADAEPEALHVPA